MKIGTREIGQSCPTFIIAELSANHGQRLELALEIVRCAAKAGADAVKLQTYTADTLTLDCDNEYFQIRNGTIWDGTTLHKLYQEAYTPWEWQAQIKALANELGMECFSSPFDETAVDFLEDLNVPAYKIASFELVDLPLISRVAQTGKPMIMSTGMATLGEIDDAVRVARTGGCTELALLVCSSAYPAAPNTIHLRRLAHLKETFACNVGLSDHTLGIAVPIAAVALGATVVEKHLTLRRSDGGPDAAFSLEPDEFRQMVESVRVAEKALGAVEYGRDAESSSRKYRRSLFFVRDVRAGSVISAKDIRSIRPGDGLAPIHAAEIVGRKAAADIERGTPVSWDHVGPKR